MMGDVVELHERQWDSFLSTLHVGFFTVGYYKMVGEVDGYIRTYRCRTSVDILLCRGGLSMKQYIVIKRSVRSTYWYDLVRGY